MNRKQSIAAAVVVALAVLVMGLFGTVKIGVVNSQELISKSDAGKEAAAELAAFVQEKNAEVAAKRDELAALQKKLEGMKQSDKAFEEASTALESGAQDLARLVQESRMAVRAKDQELTQKLLPEALKAVRSIGLEEGYTVIFDSNTGRIIYSDVSVELTPKAVSRFNAKFNAGE